MAGLRNLLAHEYLEIDPQIKSRPQGLRAPEKESRLPVQLIKTCPVAGSGQVCPDSAAGQVILKYIKK